MRPIDATALIIDLMDRGIEGLQTDDFHEIQQAVDDAPTLDVRLVVHGHWIEKGTDEICSVCGMRFVEMAFSYDTSGHDGYVRNFCPNCGNPMDGKEDERGVALNAVAASCANK